MLLLLKYIQISKLKAFSIIQISECICAICAMCAMSSLWFRSPTTSSDAETDSKLINIMWSEFQAPTVASLFQLQMALMRRSSMGKCRMSYKLNCLHYLTMFSSTSTRISQVWCLQHIWMSTWLPRSGNQRNCWLHIKLNIIRMTTLRCVSRRVFINWRSWLLLFLENGSR